SLVDRRTRRELPEFLSQSQGRSESILVLVSCRFKLRVITMRLPPSDGSRARGRKKKKMEQEAAIPATHLEYPPVPNQTILSTLDQSLTMKHKDHQPEV